jgi:hypothetical protein
MPRAPIISSERKSGTYDAPDGYKRDIMRWRDAARDEAIQTLQLNPEYEHVQTYINWLEGEHWNKDRPRYRSRFHDNRMLEARMEAISLLSDIRPTMSVSSKVPAYDHHGEIALNCIQHEWFRNNFDLELVRAVDHALLSVGYWKIGASMPGSINIVACGMDSVLPIQPGRTMQDSTAVLYRTYKPIQYFINVFGEKAHGLERQTVSSHWASTNNQYVRPGHVTEHTWNAMSPAMRHHLGIRAPRKAPAAAGVFPVIELEEYWIDDPEINDSSNTVIVKDPNLSLDQHNYHYKVAPGQRLFPRKRLLIFAGDKIMYDGPSPYWHGLFPFAQLALNPVVWAPGGLSRYRPLLPLNKMINEIGAGVGDVIKRAIVPQMITKDGAVKDASWRQFFPDLPGGKLKLTPIADTVRDVRYMDPPILPSYVFAFLQQYLVPTFDRRSGRIDVTGLGRKKQVPGGDTIEQMRDSMQTQFRMESRYIEDFLMDAGVQSVSNVFQFFTAKQRMQILGADGITWDDFDYDPSTITPWSMPREDHWKMFSMRVAQGSLHGASKDRDKQVAISLFRLGGISRREMLRRLEVENIDNIEEELMREKAPMLEPNATGKGQVPRLSRSERSGNPY